MWSMPITQSTVVISTTLGELRRLRKETLGQNIVYLYEPRTCAPLARIGQVEGQVLFLVISGKSPKLSENTEKRYAQIRSRSTGSITTSDGFRCDPAAN